MKKSKPTYAGAIKNSGNQIVKAPLNTGTKCGNTKASKGKDMRNGK